MNFISMKGSFIGIFITLILILTIPVLFLLSQENKLLGSKQPNPTPTPIKMTFANGEGIIEGYVYHDTNRDGKREAEEKPFSDVKMEMKILTEDNSKQQTLDATTDTYGYFSFHFPSNSKDSYMIKLVLPQNYQTVDTNPVIVSDMQPNTQKIVEFGLALSGDITPSPTNKPTTKQIGETSPTPSQ